MLTLLVSSVSLGQTGKPTVVIHTSSECGTCKQIMEDKLNYVCEEERLDRRQVNQSKAR